MNAPTVYGPAYLRVSSEAVTMLLGAALLGRERSTPALADTTFCTPLESQYNTTSDAVALWGFCRHVEQCKQTDAFTRMWWKRVLEYAMEDHG